MRTKFTAFMATASLVLPLALPLALGACAADGPGNKQTAGTLLGAVAGAVAGAQFGKGQGRIAAVGLGTLLGAWAGNEVGASLDRADRLAMGSATNTALETRPSGTATTWRNPDSGHYGTVTPTRTIQQSSGQYCREYSQTVTIGGRTEDAYGKACRQPDGSWQIVNN